MDLGFGLVHRVLLSLCTRSGATSIHIRFDSSYSRTKFDRLAPHCVPGYFYRPKLRRKQHRLPGLRTGVIERQVKRSRQCGGASNRVEEQRDGKDGAGPQAASLPCGGIAHVHIYPSMSCPLGLTKCTMSSVSTSRYL